MDLLNRIRAGNGTVVMAEGKSDYQVLRGRTLDKLQLNRPDEYHQLRNAPVVFGERRLRDLYNDLKAKEFARETGQEFHVYLAVDKINKQVVQRDERIRLSYAPTKESKEALSRLPLIPGMLGHDNRESVDAKQGRQRPDSASTHTSMGIHRLQSPREIYGRADCGFG